MLDLIRETYQALKLNKLRTALTGFSVAWGIYILIVLLGVANSFLGATVNQISGSGDTTTTIYPYSTSKPYAGYDEGRTIHFDATDVNFVKDNMDSRVEQASSWIMLTDTARYEGDYSVIEVAGCAPSNFGGPEQKLTDGRILSAIDLQESRKVGVISAAAAREIFQSEEGCIGKELRIGPASYTIVGLIKFQMEDTKKQIWIPFTTYTKVYSAKTHYISNINLKTNGVDTKEADERFQKDVRALFAARKQFDPTDNSAIWMRSGISRQESSSQAVFWINFAVWMIGILTLLSGIVGLSNIMFVSVKERTHEIGIRRAIGAKPRNIYTMVMAESVSIMLLFGYVGLVFGVATTEAVNIALAEYGKDTMAEMFANIHVDLGIAVQTTFAMVAAGMIAGIFPARKATKINPVEALNYE